MDLLQVLSLSATIIGLYFLCFFVVGTLIKNNAIVDLGWGMGFVVTAAAISTIVATRYATPVDPVSLLLITLLAFWGLRLSGHLIARNHGKPEDFRYANWRKEWGKWVVPRAFLQVYLLQGLMMFIIGSAPFYALAQPGKMVNLGVIIGAVVWSVGYYFEVVGDRQLAKFKADPNNRGRLIITGLWSLTRHPNYFGEATMWWGIGLIVISATGWWYALISPLVINYLLVFVSGVPLLENKYKGRADFEAYCKTTPKFVPKLWDNVK